MGSCEIEVKWIRVQDSLPLNRTDILFCGENPEKQEEIKVFSGWYDYEDQQFLSNGRGLFDFLYASIDDVTHWSYYPEVPKDVDEKVKK